MYRRSLCRLLSTATATAADAAVPVEQTFVAKTLPRSLANNLLETADQTENPVLATAMRDMAKRGTITHETLAELEDLVRKDQIPHDIVQGLASLSGLHCDQPQLPVRKL
jgi:hypothetical protein